MKLIGTFEETPAYIIDGPADPETPFVLSVPHSGTHYPRSFVSSAKLDRRAIRRSEDTHVDALFAPAASLGAAVLRAQFPRVLLDVNRSARELDPAMFSGALDVPADQDSARVAGGLGVIAKVVGEGQSIYRGLLPPEEAHARLQTLYHPYHAALTSLLDRASQTFGYAVLIDCHSMPTNAVRGSGSGASGRPNVVLGDRFGTSCAPALMSLTANALERRGYVVARNKPYAGGFITEHYGARSDVHALQIELSRSLYMDEGTYLQDVGFDTLQADLTSTVATVMAHFAPKPRSIPMAAE